MIQELFLQTKEFKWVVPTEYDLRDMDSDECRLAIKALKGLGNSEVPNPTEILYRGEKLSNLIRRYDPHTDKNIPNVLRLIRKICGRFWVREGRLIDDRVPPLDARSS
jgi:hypothetical protein